MCNLIKNFTLSINECFPPTTVYRSSMSFSLTWRNWLEYYSPFLSAAHILAGINQHHVSSADTHDNSPTPFIIASRPYRNLRSPRTCGVTFGNKIAIHLRITHWHRNGMCPESANKQNVIDAVAVKELSKLRPNRHCLGSKFSKPSSLTVYQLHINAYRFEFPQVQFRVRPIPARRADHCPCTVQIRSFQSCRCIAEQTAETRSRSYLFASLSFRVLDAAHNWYLHTGIHLQFGHRERTGRRKNRKPKTKTGRLEFKMRAIKCVWSAETRRIYGRFRSKIRNPDPWIMYHGEMDTDSNRLRPRWIIIIVPGPSHAKHQRFLFKCY